MVAAAQPTPAQMGAAILAYSAALDGKAQPTTGDQLNAIREAVIAAMNTGAAR